MEFIKFFYTRGIWLSLLILSLILIITDCIFNYIVLDIDCFTASLTIMGFVLTILVFFQGLNRDSQFMKNLIKYRKDIEFTFLCILTIVFAFISCILSMINIPGEIVSKLPIYFIIAAIFELIGVTFYMLQIIIHLRRTDNKTNL